MKLPFLLLGDGPQEATGLGRIARGLGLQIHRDFGDQLDLVQVGGAIPPVWTAWRHVPMGEIERGDDWGARYIREVYTSLWGDEPGILFAVWDPSRLYPYAALEMPVRKWAYTAVDADNVNGTISGPAADALRGFDRVLAYGRWASRVLKPLRSDGVPYLPHGFSASVYQWGPDDEEGAWIRRVLGQTYRTGQQVIGIVATNQPRKDLGLTLRAIRELIDRRHAVFCWLHTDRLVKDWSVPGLIEDLRLQNHVRVTGFGQGFAGAWTDRQLALMYQSCSVTIAPGMGEGFGYPIVESLASGTPVVHVDHAGGRELIPRREWRFPVREMRLESIYGLQRPVCRPEDVANAIERVWDWKQRVGPQVGPAYLRGTVAHLEWANLWPRWARWIRTGLEA